MVTSGVAGLCAGPANLPPSRKFGKKKQNKTKQKNDFHFTELSDRQHCKQVMLAL